MARVGLHGKVQAFSKYVEAVPVLDWLFSMIEDTLNGQVDSTNLADYVAGSVSGVTTAKINDLAVTAAKVALATLTPAQMADGVGQVTSFDYVGDGTTANRLVAIGFIPRWAKIIRLGATFIEFEVAVVGASFTYWYRDATGTQASSDANWQGISGTSLKLGTNAAGTANVNAVTYRVVAWK